MLCKMFILWCIESKLQIALNCLRDKDNEILCPMWKYLWSLHRNKRKWFDINMINQRRKTNCQKVCLLSANAKSRQPPNICVLQISVNEWPESICFKYMLQKTTKYQWEEESKSLLHFYSYSYYNHNQIRCLKLVFY